MSLPLGREHMDSSTFAVVGACDSRVRFPLLSRVWSCVRLVSRPKAAGRAELMSDYLGTLTWSQVCEVTGMDDRSLPQNVALTCLVSSDHCLLENGVRWTLS